MISIIRKFLELIRFSHTIFALPFALLAAGMAWFTNFHPEVSAVPTVAFRWWDFLGILLCMVFARSAAMAFNRLVDRKIDAKNPRTAMRHLPAGKLSVRQVACFTVVCVVGFIASTALFLPYNPLPFCASVPVLLFLMGYSLAKRFTNYVHFWLGTALMLAPIAAWVALRGEVLINNAMLWLAGKPLTITLAETSAVILAVAVCFWSAGFDIIYATMDADFDKEAGVHSIPGRFGIQNALRIAAVCHLFVPLPLLLLGFVFSPFGTIWFVGVGMIAALLLFEHGIAKTDDPQRINVAFFNVNSIISVTLLGIGALEMFLNW
ncbi:MAG: UbiA-like polyprenyltransferase [Planctomycetia bacterium]|nr:UbiA-like polyprenyltransferase [Planctomycetia bacterium]